VIENNKQNYSQDKVWQLTIIFTSIVMAFVAIPRLKIEFSRLLNPAIGHKGAIDLLLRHMEVQRWLVGEPIYETL
jgi:hypothetical protein